MIKIMLVDDQASMISGLTALISTHEDFSVILTAQSGESALEILTQLSSSEFLELPDVILMDIRMPGMGGVIATQQIKSQFPQITVLILTTFDDDDFIIDALHYGAAGYLLKDIGGKRLIESIYEALSGNLLLTGRVASKLANNIRQNQRLPISNLAFQSASSQQLAPLEDLGFSERELEIAQQIALGLNAKEISKATFLSSGTVKNYISNIYAKLGVNDRVKAMIILREILNLEQK
jgi:DNA-binding NarL/FixJ family response regulator